MEDKHEKEMMRNQLIAFILMAVLVVVYFKFFLPPPPKQPAPAPKPIQSQQESTQRDAAQTEPAQPVWPELPPVPDIDDPAAYEARLSNQNLDLVFTRIGARLKQASVLAQNSGGVQQLVPQSAKPDTQAVYPLGLSFTEEGLRDQLDHRLWEVAQNGGNSIVFELTIPGRGAIQKKFTLDPQTHVLEIEVAYRSLAAEDLAFGLDQTPAYYLNWAPNVTSGDQKMRGGQLVVWHKGGQNEEVPTAKMSKNGAPYFMTTPAVDWIAVKSTYFVVALKPEFEGAAGLAEGVPGDFCVGLGTPRFSLAPGETQTHGFRVYLGPNEQVALTQGWKTLETAQQFFGKSWWWMDWFAKLLLALLNWFYAHIIANYGLAIIFLTAVVRIAMFPLTLKSMKSMKKMQLLGPELEQLKEKYGENQQELNKKMMEMYRERGVNPVGGCFPMLLQMPVFIALYRMLWQAYELRGAHFLLWITDLSQPDHLFHLPGLANVPLVGMFEYINLLPILMGISMVASQKVIPTTGPATNPQQKLMMNIMPVFFSFICYNMASGLNLYILTSTVLGMLQQKFVRVGEIELQPKKTPPKKQHFYTAAMARKRQLEKEAKKDSKRKSK
ncbi:MAG TPA: membrane protein insertase YidC [Candidatus Bathyarchaeia archaeon]|nr:membrane protein insertase YidC [Candidatus Bathyarchaeia archaeon]